MSLKFQYAYVKTQFFAENVKKIGFNFSELYKNHSVYDCIHIKILLMKVHLFVSLGWFFFKASPLVAYPTFCCLSTIDMLLLVLLSLSLSWLSLLNILLRTVGA